MSQLTAVLLVSSQLPALCQIARYSDSGNGYLLSDLAILRALTAPLAALTGPERTTGWAGGG